MAVSRCLKRLLWPVSAVGISRKPPGGHACLSATTPASRRDQNSGVVINRFGRYLPYEVAALARVGGRYQPCLRAATPASRRPRRPLGVIKTKTWLSTALAVICCRKRLFWPVSVAIMSRSGR